MPVFDKANDAHFQSGNQPPVPKPRGTPLKTQITSKLEDYNLLVICPIQRIQYHSSY